MSGYRARHRAEPSLWVMVARCIVFGVNRQAGLR